MFIYYWILGLSFSFNVWLVVVIYVQAKKIKRWKRAAVDTAWTQANRIKCNHFYKWQTQAKVKKCNNCDHVVVVYPEGSEIPV